MGGAQWTPTEEKHFWKHVIPHSAKRVGPDRAAHAERTWADLGKEMQVALGNSAKRNYTQLCLYEHFFQAIVSKNPMPNARGHVQKYRKKMSADPVTNKEILNQHPNILDGKNKNGHPGGVRKAKNNDVKGKGKANLKARVEAIMDRPAFLQPPPTQMTGADSFEQLVNAANAATKEYDVGKREEAAGYQYNNQMAAPFLSMNGAMLPNGYAAGTSGPGLVQRYTQQHSYTQTSSYSDHTHMYSNHTLQPSSGSGYVNGPATPPYGTHNAAYNVTPGGIFSRAGAGSSAPAPRTQFQNSGTSLDAALEEMKVNKEAADGMFVPDL